MNNDTWVKAGEVDIWSINGLESFGLHEKMSAIKKIRDMAFMLVMLGYGETPQEVLDSFKDLSYGAWIKTEVPYMVRASEMGSTYVEISDVRCSIDGIVSFSVEILGEEVDLCMSWDRFLLSATINARNDDYESL